MNILERIEELMSQGISEENAEIIVDQEYNYDKE